MTKPRNKTPQRWFDLANIADPSERFLAVEVIDALRGLRGLARPAPEWRSAIRVYLRAKEALASYRLRKAAQNYFVEVDAILSLREDYQDNRHELHAAEDKLRKLLGMAQSPFRETSR